MSDFFPQPAQAPVYSWAVPPQSQWVETEPLEYHRLYRGTRRYRWWKPLVALVLGVAYFFAFSIVFAIAVIVPYLMITDSSFDERSIMELAIPDTQNPMSLIVSLGSIVLMIPSVWLAMLSTGLGPIGRAWSVAGRIRWRWIGRTLLPALCALVVMTVVGFALEIAFAGGLRGGLGEELFGGAPRIDWSIALVSSVIVLLLVPLQATAEELVFRGMFMQVLGAWIRTPWPAIVLTAFVFALGHLYDIWGLAAIGVMGLATAWITWRTGGLEAAISIHVVNNWVAFGLMTFGLSSDTAQSASSGGAGSLLGSIIGLVGYVWWVDRDFRRRDGRRTRIDVVEVRSAIPPSQYLYPPPVEYPSQSQYPYPGGYSS